MTESDLRRLYELIADNEEAVTLVNELVKEVKALTIDNAYDELTKAYNRRILKEEVDYDIVIMCDVDNFKKFNDVHGHGVGDKILVLISRLLRSITRGNDFVCRYGGDEFIIVLKKCDVEDAIIKLQAIQQQIPTVKGCDINITLSFGLTAYEEGKTLEAAIGEADEALASSKGEGKNRITVYKKPEQGLVKRKNM